MKLWLPATTVAIILMAGCASGGRRDREQAPYRPLAEVERTYGPLVTAGNHPTVEQHGTGERVGLFRDASGTYWGLPVIVDNNGEMLACAPPKFQSSKVTDGFDAGASIVGSTNAPTGWRGGTGDLELLLRDQSGTLRRQAVHGADMPGDPACWAPEIPGPRQRLHYYRLAPTQAEARR